MIEQLQPTDWQRLKQIRVAALKDSPDSFGSTLDEELMRSDAEWEEDLRGLATFLVSVDRADQGMVRCVPDRRFPSKMRLIGMWVAPDSRRLGLAEKLIHTAIEWACSKGCDELILDVADHNNSAIALYEKLMFKPNGVTGHLPSPRQHITEHSRVRVL